MTDRIYTSNLILDKELAVEFNRVAYQIAGKLRLKYFSLFTYMSEDDVVMECWDKILSQDISFRTDKPFKFESFVWMIVNCKCIDMSRKIRKHANLISLDGVITIGNQSQNMSMDKILADERLDFIRDIEVQDIQREFSEISDEVDCGGLSLTKVLTLRQEGFNYKEIGEMYGVNSSKLSGMVKLFQGILENRIQDTGSPLEEILFNEELGYFTSHPKEDFLKALSFIEEKEYGIKLSDVVKMVLDDYSYTQIAEKFAVRCHTVQNFLEKCLPIVF